MTDQGAIRTGPPHAFAMRFLFAVFVLSLATPCAAKDRDLITPTTEQHFHFGSFIPFERPPHWEYLGGALVVTIVLTALLTAAVAAALVQMQRRRHAERSLRESEERLTFALASSNMGFWQYDAVTGRFQASEQCRSMFGIDAEAPLTHRTFLSAVHPDDRRILGVATQTSADAEASCEFRVPLPNAQQRWLTARKHLRFDENGELAEICGVFRDITARKAFESEAAVHRREIAHLMRVSVMGELSGAIAHELNQPLTAILSNAQAAQKILSQKYPDMVELADALNDIVQDDNRASAVIHRLRRLHGKGQGRSEAVDVNDVAGSTMQLLHSELISRRTRIESELDADRPRVWGDPIQLQQVLLNLMMNAIEAMESTPCSRRLISVTTHSNVGSVDVIVSDRGPGITIDQSAQVFEPFFTTKEHGLGLGLAICSTIVTAHGGQIRLANGTDGGAIARLTLPALSGQEALVVAK